MAYIAMIFLVLFLATFTRNIYLKKSFSEKIAENKKQIIFQEMASDISDEFSSLSYENFHQKVDYLLESLGNLLEVDRDITMVMIKPAKSLGLTVLAEGVETRQQLEYLKKKECDYIQGYYYYRPMPAGEIEKLLSKYGK